MFCLACTGRRRCVTLQDNRLGRVTVCTAPFIPKLGKQRQWPASRYTSFTVEQNSKQYTMNSKLGGKQNQSAPAPFLPSGCWLSIMTTGQSNIGMRLHGYWVIWYCTNFKAAGNLRSWATWSFCDAPAAKPSPGGNISRIYCDHLDKAFWHNTIA